MLKITHLTIGIPAYNEENNIGLLLQDLLMQTYTGLVLDRVHVVSDASTDQTTAIVKGFGALPIHLSVQKKRQGIGTALNKILSSSQSDLVVILNADVRIRDKDFLVKLTKPISSGQVDLTSCNLLASNTTSLISRILDVSMQVKTNIFETIRKGDNVYNCHGTARAFSKELAKVIRFPFSVGEDAYSYLFAKRAGFRFRYVKSTIVYYSLPQTFEDHWKQSTRYAVSKTICEEALGSVFVRDQYHIPFWELVRSTASEFLRHPLEVFAYFWIRCYIQLVQLVHKQPIANTWTVASTSKQVEA